MPTTAYITHQHYTQHNIPGHPERPERMTAIWKELESAGLLADLHAVEPRPIADETILWVHTRQYLERLNIAENHDYGVRFDADTLALPQTPRIARLSAGGVLQAVDEVLAGRAENALAITRPPGHHAIPERAMGFCYLGNIALAARYAQKQFGLQRVMIVDFDVHHGNGTQDMFYDDDSVLFISTHQYPYYPGTGALEDTGTGKGRGYTINIPLSAGHGDAEYRRIYREIVWPAARRFQPEIILVSAGYDAHWDDPLAMMNLSLRGYGELSQELVQMADELCGGKIVFVLEGGYNLQVLAHGVRNATHALLKQDQVSDPLGVKRISERDITPLLNHLKRLHALA